MSALTIVIPWYGPDTVGGAESQARALALALRRLGVDISVWTTDGKDSFAPPAPHYSAGDAELDGVTIRRFPIDAPFAGFPIPAPLLGRTYIAPQFWQLLPEHELRLLASLPSSAALLAAIAADRSDRRFIFMIYPFPTTFWGLILAGERGALLPCLHDEPYARYSSYAGMFRAARLVLANSGAERALALRLYDLPPERMVVAGEGIDLTPAGDGARFRAEFDIDGPLLVAVGRRSTPGKNIPLLLSYLREYLRRRGRTLTLALVGRDDLAIAPSLRPWVRDLGYLSAQQKADAYAAADVFVHPSVHESFSIVLMEAWLQRAPALVHAACDVTREAAASSEAGVWFGDFGTFAAALDTLLDDAPLRRAMGERGRSWVLANCRWEDVARRTAAAVLGDTSEMHYPMSASL